METIITAIITGFVTLVGVILSNSKNQAVTDTKIDELTREVREHNNFARRVPILENNVSSIEKRLTILEGLHKRV